MKLSAETREWVGQNTGIAPANIDFIPLKGANASLVFLVRNGSVPQFVLRVLDNQKWLDEEPDLVQHEVAALHEAQRTSITAPAIIAASEKTELPMLLMSHLEGQVDLQPARPHQWLEQSAAQLARLHHHRAPHFRWSYQSWVDKNHLCVPDRTRHPTLWKDAIALFSDTEPAYEAVFIHRDYHPCNILWRGSSPSGIVDWVNACQGPAGVDAGHFRINLALLFDIPTADQFLEMYLRANRDFVYDPYWDIDSIFNMCLPKPEFYKPWKDFGIKVLLQEELQRRTDELLLNVMRKI